MRRQQEVSFLTRGKKCAVIGEAKLSAQRRGEQHGRRLFCTFVKSVEKVPFVRQGVRLAEVL